ncbi:unnamed protein product [Sphagnum jensenii]|uniref:Expansin n=1 Tax=Sphagnum jensenii TaxID=128206 RepID=A0ABP0WCM9_9BRYO
MAAFFRELLLVLALLVCIFADRLPLYSCQSSNDTQWQSATNGATWYGAPDGDGSDAGACGYGILSSSPYGSSITAVNAPLFQDGAGCGVCYEIQCTNSGLCKSTPTTVVVTDLCPGGAWCDGSNPHFDLSGTAFSNLAVPGQEEALRTVGVLDPLLYKRVPCSYPAGTTISFTVDPGSNSFWLALVIKYVGGPGDIQAVQIQQAGDNSGWQSMTHNWGANWMFQSTTGGPIQGPLSIRLAAKLDGQVTVADNVIPAGYSNGATYSSSVQFA